MFALLLASLIAHATPQDEMTHAREVVTRYAQNHRTQLFTFDQGTFGIMCPLGVLCPSNDEALILEAPGVSVFFDKNDFANLSLAELRRTFMQVSVDADIAPQLGLTGFTVQLWQGNNVQRNGQWRIDDLSNGRLKLTASGSAKLIIRRKEDAQSVSLGCMVQDAPAPAACVSSVDGPLDFLVMIDMALPSGPKDCTHSGIDSNDGCGQ